MKKRDWYFFLFVSAVDGKWSAWGNWGHFRHCSETCGYGVKYRYRYRACNDPEPENGGKKCPGLLRDEEFKRCHLRKCPSKVYDSQDFSRNANVMIKYVHLKKEK